MKSTIRKYKNYRIEKCYTNSDGGGGHFVASPEIWEELRDLRANKIQRPWHGQECLCEECTYTEADHKHNREIEEECKYLILKRKVATIKRPTLRECKAEIDELTLDSN